MHFEILLLNHSSLSTIRLTLMIIDDFRLFFLLILKLIRSFFPIYIFIYRNGVGAVLPTRLQMEKLFHFSSTFKRNAREEEEISFIVTSAVLNKKVSTISYSFSKSSGLPCVHIF